MDQKTFISDADKALATLIWACLENDSEAKNIISSKENIAFSSPKAATNGTRKLSLFLYNITEGKTTSSPAFVLHYLITPSTGNDKDDHVLLEKIINAVLTIPLAVSSSDEHKVGLTVKLDSLTLEELTNLWISLDVTLRPSVGLAVSASEPQYNSQTQGIIATQAPQAPTVDPEKVAQLYQAVLKTFTEQSNGWKNRNMVVKQWVFQEFKKSTDMSVDEMNAALDSLGNRLEQHGTTTQFIKPLTQLALYYQHQLDQLKGMQKVSRNQGENLETLNKWIKEVMDLAEALSSRP
jgi:hypothetical protein